MNGYGAAWTEQRVATLKQLWADGLTAPQCARELGGITRNAVIGKVHRLGLAGPQRRFYAPRTKQPRQTNAVHTHRANGHRPLTMPDAEQVEALDLPPDTSPDACTLMDLKADSCRWPMGEPGTEAFRYCGTGHDGAFGSYCLRHARLAYQPKALRPVSTWGTQ